MITVGLDLGGTNIRAAALGEEGSLHSVHKERLVDKAPEKVLRSVAALVEAVADDARGSTESISALCVALAGQLNHPRGLVAIGPNLGWVDVPFREMLASVFSFPVRVENDLSAAAWGERVAGAGKGADHLALVAVGSGVGAGIIEDGKLLTGACGLAAEIGHTKVVRGGEQCGCGELGCLEAYTGGHRMALRALRLWEEAGLERPMGLAQESITMETVHEAFENGDAVARRVIEEAGEHLGLAVANLVTLLNPSTLVLGGGVLLGVPYLSEKIRNDVAALTAAPARRSVNIEFASLGDDAGLVGAGHLAREIAKKR